MTNNKAGKFIFDEANFQLIINGKGVILTPQEFSIIKYFIENPNRVIPRKELVIKALNEKFTYAYIDEKRINNIIWRLRKKIENNLNYPNILVAVRGHGYRLNS